jgi:hypothetical protein
MSASVTCCRSSTRASPPRRTRFFPEHQRFELRFHDAIDSLRETAPPTLEDVGQILFLGRVDRQPINRSSSPDPLPRRIFALAGGPGPACRASAAIAFR